MALIRRRPRSWPGWATLVHLALSCVYVLISPQYIEPLFNRISPLIDGPEKQAILSLSRANGVPANDVFVRDASRQSDLLNAHVSGIGGTARIVLDDNTISKTPKSEFELVMAHELGHYVLAHIPKAIVFDSLITGNWLRPDRLERPATVRPARTAVAMRWRAEHPIVTEH